MRKIILACTALAAALGACGGPKNLPPQFSPAPPASTNPQQNGDTFDIPISVTDPNGDVVTVTVTGLPPGILLEQTWQVSTVAGVGPIGHTKGGYADGPGLSTAQFRHPGDIAIDASGNLFVTDIDNHRIRKITANGDVSTFAGDGSPGYADGAGSVARFNQPNGIAIDSAGNLFVADDGNARIRQIDPSGNVTTVAGMSFNAAAAAGFPDGNGTAAGFAHPTGIAVHPSGDIYVADCSSSSAIRRIDAARNVTTVSKANPGFQDGPLGVAKFLCPYAVAIDGAGDVLIADSQNHRIRKISSNGIVTSIAGSGNQYDVSVPSGIDVDSKGVIFFSEAGNYRIQRLVEGSAPTIIAGDIMSLNGYLDGPGDIARFNDPQGLAIDKLGIIYVADTSNNKIRKLSPIGYRLAGKYEGDPCGGEFDVVLEADDGKGGKTKTTVTLFVPATPQCPTFDRSTPQSPYNVGIVKSYPAAAFAGGNANFALTLTNNGSAPIEAALGIRVQDPAPGLFPSISGNAPNGWNCATYISTPNFMRCDYNGPPVMPGQSFPQIMVTAPAPNVGVFRNCATVSFLSAADADVSDNESCVDGDVIPAPPPDAAIVKTLAEPSVAGGPTVFTIVVSNPGLVQHSGQMYVEDKLPANLANPKNVSDPAAKWKCIFNGPDMYCFIFGTIASPVVGAAPGASYPPLVIEADQVVPGEYENCATIVQEGDVNPANDTSCVKKTVPANTAPATTGGGTTAGATGSSGSNNTTPPPPTFDVSARKALQTFQYPNGLATIFAITVRNEGPAPIDASTGIVVADTLPSNFAPPATIRGGPKNLEWDCSVSGLAISCAYIGGPRTAGEDLPTIVIEAFGKTPGKYENCATATLQAVVDAVPANNTGCAAGEIGPAPSPTGLLEIMKVVVDSTGGTALPAGYKFPIFLSCSNNPGIWVPVPLGANTSTTSPPSPAGITCSAAENWGAAGPGVPAAKCPSGRATWTPSYAPDSGQGAATVKIPAGGTARIVITNTLTCDNTAPPPPPAATAQLIIEKLVEELGKGMSWKKPLPTGPNAAFTIEVTCPSLNGGKPVSLELEHQKSQTISVAVGETCTVVEPSQATPSALPCAWELAGTSYLDVAANKTTTSGASVTLGAAKTYTVRVTNTAHCPGLF